MVDIEETPLPGVGVRHDFPCRSGARVGVISRTSGRRELVIYDRHDPDAVRAQADLSPEESAALSELLGGSHLTRHVEHLGEGIVPGLSIDWLPFPSHRRPTTIGELEVRSRTGTSIVAIVRDGTAIPAPGPDRELLPSDTVLVVGTPEGIAAASYLLEDDGEPTAS
jgi:TrkA domain protein